MAKKTKSEKNFEACFAELEKAADSLKNEDLTLEESYNCYKEGMEYYEVCRQMLDDMKQKIEVYDKRLDTLKDAQENLC